MKKIKLAAISLLLFSQFCYAQHSASFQLLVPTPDPQEAGSKVRFQIIIKNSGLTEWESGNFYLSADLFDNNKNYLSKSDRLWSEKSIIPGQAGLFYIDYQLLQNWVGKHFFRVNLFVENKLIAQSDYISFMVEPFIQIPSVPPPVKLGGNVVLSQRYDYSQDIKNSHSSDVNISIFGKVYEKSMRFNSYVSHTSEEQFEINKILFHLQSANYNFRAGDIMPKFTKFSMDGAGMDGCYLLYTGRDSKYFSSLAFGQNISAREGTALTNGVFSRYIYGASFGRRQKTWEIAITGVQSADEKDSITEPGPAKTPQRNRLSSVQLKYRPLGFLDLEGEYGYSWLVEDIDTSAGKKQGHAWRVNADIGAGGLEWKNKFSITGPDFSAPGNPLLIEDRLNYYTSINCGFSSLVSAGLKYDYFKDNLNKSQNELTLENRSAGFEIVLTPRELPSAEAGVELSRVKANPLSGANNITKSYYFNTDIDLWKLKFNTGVRKSEFRDRTTGGNDSDTDIGFLNCYFAIGRFFTSNLGTSISRNLDLDDSSHVDTYSQSLVLNFALRNKKNVSFWIRNLTYKGNSSLNPVNKNTFNTDVEFSRALIGNSRIVAGIGGKKFSDHSEDKNSYTSYKGTVRLVMSF